MSELVVRLRFLCCEKLRGELLMGSADKVTSKTGVRAKDEGNEAT